MYQPLRCPVVPWSCAPRAAALALVAVGVLLGSVTARAGQTRSGTLSLETVEDRPRDPRNPADEGLRHHDARVTVYAETGTRERIVDCHGWCDVEGLPAGDYRVFVEFTLADRSVVSAAVRVPVRSNRPTYLRVKRPREGHRELVAPEITPSSGRLPHTYVAVPEPADLAWPIAEVCGQPLQIDRRQSPERWPLPARAHESQVWGDLRRWWGGVAGTLTDSANRPLARVPVYLEFLDTGTARTTVPPLDSRSTEAGCFGLHGLWPGGYRLVADTPPFAVLAHSDVTGRTDAGMTTHDVTVTVVSPDRTEPQLDIDSRWLGRVRSAHALLRVMQRLETEPTRDPDYAEVEVIGQAVWWPDSRNWQNVLRVPDARVVFTHERSGRTFEKVTDEHGVYAVRVPFGVYRVEVVESRFFSVHARVIVTREGHAVLDNGFRVAGETRSGIWRPGVTFRSGLMLALHFDLGLKVVQSTASNGEMVTVEGRALSSVAAPLAVEFTRRPDEGGPPQESLWTQPLTHHALVGRTVQSVHPLTPGLVYTEATTTLGQFTAAGQRRYANRLTIDGAPADLGISLRRERGIDQPGSGPLPAVGATGATNTLVPADAIDKTRVYTTHATAELARTPGAQTAIVTRAGSERFTGNLFTALRPGTLGATDFFDNAGGVRRRRDHLAAGVALGGPLVRSHTQYWMAFEQQQFDRSATMTLPVPSRAMREAAPTALRAVLDAFPQPNGPALPEDAFGPGLATYTGEVPATSELRVISGRVDTRVRDRHRVALRLNHGLSGADSASLDRQKPFNYRSWESTATTTATAMLTSMAPSYLHDLLVNVTRHAGALETGAPTYGGASAPVLDPFLPPGVGADDIFIRFQVFGATHGGLNFGRSGGATQHQIYVADAWTVPRGRHEWRVGGDYRRVIAGTTQAQNWYTYRFTDVAEFIAGRTRPVPLDRYGRARVHFQSWSLFGQDTFRVSPRVTVEYGVRYTVNPAPRSVERTQPLLIEFTTLPDVTPRPTGASLWNTSWTQIAPRAALTYRFGDAGRDTTLHVGWSLTFDERTSPGGLAFGGGFPDRWRRFVRPETFPADPNDLTAAPPPSFTESSVADAYSFPVDLRSPRTQQWHVGVDRALGGGQRLAVAYVGTAARCLPYWYAYPLNDTHTIHAFSDAASADYHGLLTAYTRRLTGGLQAHLAYTWSHAIDTDSGESEWPNLPPSVSPPSANRASADFDRRHTLFVTGSYQVPPPLTRLKGLRRFLTDWQFDMTAIVQSGAPITILEPRDIGRGRERLRPDMIPGVPMWIDDSRGPTGRSINANAFVTPAQARQGTLGRNTLRSTPLRQIDLSLQRAIRVSAAKLRVRLDLFNVLNTPNFGPPEGTLIDSPWSFGTPYQSYADAMGTGTLARGGLPPLQQAGGPRAFQISASFAW